jgi:hypothetical protein
MAKPKFHNPNKKPTKLDYETVKDEHSVGVEYDNVLNLERLAKEEHSTTTKTVPDSLDVSSFIDADPLNEMIHIKNEGPELIYTNYWETENAKKGFYYLSTNDSCIRLLAPEVPTGKALAEEFGRPTTLEDTIKEMATARSVILSRGMFEGRDSVEILFEDNTSTPFIQIIATEQCDRIWPESESGTILRNGFVVYTEHGGKVLHFDDCRVRNVEKLPCMKEWA